MSSKKYGSKFLKGFASFRVASELNSEVVFKYLSALDCPRSLAIWMLYSNNEHEQLAKIAFDPHNYNSFVECRDAYCATKFLSKNKGLNLTYDLDKVALEKFDEFELLCKQTNNRFRFLESDPLFKGPTVWLHNAIKRKISKILGDYSADEFFRTPDWGPGASTLIKRREASSVKKFQCETGITRDLYDLLPIDLLREVYPLWAGHLSSTEFPKYQIGNKVITVPKDATTNRVIAIEPGINMWFQQSVGKMIGRRLRRYGVDLRLQSRNQELARLGSITNHLATVDLSSASDSIAYAVVEELLPPRWFMLMDASRSHYGLQNNSLRKWEKFSSMGNGFTFQLESLIFYAVASCCAEYHHLGSSEVNAYGDDVILPSACFETFSKCMLFYGFRINLKKSHINSPFRESCGSHFYLGLDLKPYYHKDSLTSVPTVFRAANAIRRLAHRRNFGYGCDKAFEDTFELLVSTVPRPLRLRIPETLGDGGFISNFDEATPARARNGIEGYRIFSVMEVSKTHYDDTMGYLLSSLWLISKRDGSLSEPSRSRTKLEAIDDLIGDANPSGRNSVPVRTRVIFKVVNSLVQQWYDLGPWL